MTTPQTPPRSFAHLEGEILRPLSRREFERLIELGIIGEDERVELISGVLLAMSPIGRRHAYVVNLLTRLLVTRLPQVMVSVQGPFAASDDSELQPDVALLPLDTRHDTDWNRAHLVIEVAESSLRRDRVLKLPLYARAGVPEYWIVDLAGGRVDVLTDPDASGDYRTKRTFQRGDAIALVAFPAVTVAVADFLPEQD